MALFTDTFHEANGVATLSRQLAEFAQTRGLPLLVARGGRQNSLSRDGSVEMLELKRGAASFQVDKNLSCDPLLTRHKRFALNHLAAFKPDLVHITGPGDVGFLGLWLAHILRVPLAASWHTNLHEYLARRLSLALRFSPAKLRLQAASVVERESLRGLLRFYRSARFIMAPNRPLVDLLHERTGKPAFVMQHGVDLTAYSPAPQQENGAHRNGAHPFCIGYVGRLTTEKNVRSFVELERQLLAAGERDYRFLVVGEGGQQKWLRKHLLQAEIPGVLRGKELAAAYARMDAFVFPSRTDTFGLVILEAMASGVPVILAPETGRRIGLEDGVSGLLSEDFAASLQRLMRDRRLRLAISGAARDFSNGNSWNAAFEHLYQTYAAGLAIGNEKCEYKKAAK